MDSKSTVLPKLDDLEAPGQGVEPRFAGSEPAVLPLDDPGIVTATAAARIAGAQYVADG